MPVPASPLSALTPELLSSLVEQIPVVVYVADFDGDFALRYVSPRITALTGRTPAEMTEDPEEWYRCIHPDDVERVRDLEQRSYVQEQEFDCDFRFVHRDGRVFHVLERDF